MIIILVCYSKDCWYPINLISIIKANKCPAICMINMYIYIYKGLSLLALTGRYAIALIAVCFALDGLTFSFVSAVLPVHYKHVVTWNCCECVKRVHEIIDRSGTLLFVDQRMALWYSTTNYWSRAVQKAWELQRRQRSRSISLGPSIELPKSGDTSATIYWMLWAVHLDTIEAEIKMSAIFQTTFWNAFSWFKMYTLRLGFH